MSGLNTAKRKATSKKLRFEVFKRDSFTCQYCGAQPPSVVLVCDHVEPVKLGGKTSLDNLITSCEQCNQGKSANPLTSVHPRPDADLMNLQVQQEIAELVRYKDAHFRLMREREEIAEILQMKSFAANNQEWAPSTYPLITLLEKFPVEICEETVLILSVAVGTGRISAEDSCWIPYMYGIANRLNKKLEDNEN